MPIIVSLFFAWVARTGGSMPQSMSFCDRKGSKKYRKGSCAANQGRVNSKAKRAIALGLNFFFI